jgi:DnaK suppressor protein
MKKKDLHFFKDYLTKWLDELSENADDTVDGLRASDDHLTDPLDQGLADWAQFLKLRIRTRQSKLIKKIERSLLDNENTVLFNTDRCI